MLPFLEKVLPSVGHYYTGHPYKYDSKGRTRKAYRHTAHRTIHEVSKWCLECSSRGESAHFALAAFKERLRKNRSGKKAPNRRKQNVKCLRSMWINMDCADDKRGALQSIVDFVGAAPLPPPTFVIDSGYGLHVYWCFERDILIEEWQPIAEVLLETLHSAGVACDDMTVDSTRMMRMPGTLNIKGDTPVPVRCIHEGAVVEWKEWCAAIYTARPAQASEAPLEYITPHAFPLQPGLATVPFTASQTAKMSEAGASGIPARADLVADKCGVLGAMREGRGAGQTAGAWWAALGVLAKCVDGAEKAHEWSVGHENYNEDETNEKLEGWASVGPTTCAKFRTMCGECAGCPHDVKSPILLGREEPKGAVAVQEEPKGDVAMVAGVPVVGVAAGRGDGIRERGCAPGADGRQVRNADGRRHNGRRPESRDGEHRVDTRHPLQAHPALHLLGQGRERDGGVSPSCGCLLERRRDKSKVDPVERGWRRRGHT